MYVMRRRGSVAVWEIHWLVGTAEDSFSHFVETEELSLFSTDEVIGAMRDAGLDAVHDTRGLHGYGAMVARAERWSADEIAAIHAALANSCAKHGNSWSRSPHGMAPTSGCSISSGSARTSLDSYRHSFMPAGRKSPPPGPSRLCGCPRWYARHGARERCRSRQIPLPDGRNRAGGHARGHRARRHRLKARGVSRTGGADGRRSRPHQRGCGASD
jgi:hypothetical protein